MHDVPPFSGVKLALFYGGHLVIYKRGEKLGTPFLGYWDFPGGGREDLETPAECVLRELEEEFPIRLEEPRIEWQRQYPSTNGSAPFVYFLVARLEDCEFRAICFGGEGQYWRLMEVDAYLVHVMAIPYLQSRLGDYLREHRHIGEQRG